MTLLIHLGSTEDPILVTVAFLASAATVAATLYAARLITRILGRNGVKAMARFMALIIASVAAEMLHGAVVYWVRELGLA
jgi:small neutral amino acid transporter SnatA (MarC family)